MTDQDDDWWDGELRADGQHVAAGRIQWLTGTTTLAIRFHTEPLSSEQRRSINEGPLELHFTDLKGKARWIPDESMSADQLVFENPREVFLTSTDDNEWQWRP
jgi:hypothetical protein